MPNRGCVTMPIKWGLLRSVRFVQVLSILVVIPLIIASVKLINTHWFTLGMYTSLALGLPVIIWAFWLQKEYHTTLSRCKHTNKIHHAIGVVSLIIYYLQVHG